MKRLALVLFLALAASPLFADSTLWYNGDFNGANGLSNEVNTQVTQSYVFDDFIVPAGGETLTGTFSNNLMNFATTTADVEIRSGVSEGNGGTLIYGAYGVADTQTATGRSGFGYTEYTVAVDLPDVSLAAGTYWLAVAPIDNTANSGSDGSDRSYISTTTGANCVGTPCGNDDDSFFESSYFSANYDAASNHNIVPPADFSMGVSGTSGSPVPEPSSLLLLGTGLVGLAGALRRKLAR